MVRIKFSFKYNTANLLCISANLGTKDFATIGILWTQPECTHVCLVEQTLAKHSGWYIRLHANMYIPTTSSASNANPQPEQTPSKCILTSNPTICGVGVMVSNTPLFTCCNSDSVNWTCAVASSNSDTDLSYNTCTLTCTNNQHSAYYQTGINL